MWDKSPARRAYGARRYVLPGTVPLAAAPSLERTTWTTWVTSDPRMGLFSICFFYLSFDIQGLFMKAREFRKRAGLWALLQRGDVTMWMLQSMMRAMRGRSKVISRFRSTQLYLHINFCPNGSNKLARGQDEQWKSKLDFPTSINSHIRVRSVSNAWVKVSMNFRWGSADSRLTCALCRVFFLRRRISMYPVSNGLQITVKLIMVKLMMI